MDGFTIREATAGDFDDLARLRIEAFSPDEGSKTWFRERGSVDDTLVADASGRVVACAKFLPVGQFFGDRRVPMGAVCSVAVETAWRGRGVAPALMRDLVGAMRNDGLALSLLYASTMRLYRGVGFEPAGEGTNTQVPVSAFTGLDRGTPQHLRSAGPDDAAAIRACYERVARGRNGWIDRSDIWWHRYRSLAPTPGEERGRHVLAFERDGRVEGYAMRRQPTGGFPVSEERFILEELVADDPVVTQTLWASVGLHAMQAKSIIVEAVPAEELLLVLDEQWHEIRAGISDRTLSRILDVPAAIAARGYPAGLDARVVLDVRDEVVGDNDGRFLLEVSDGSATATPHAPGPGGGGGPGGDDGADGVVSLDIGALSALYTGWTSATTLARHGRVTGPADALATLDTVFAGPTPFCADDF